MAIILNIETATTNCSVSLSKEGIPFILKEDYDKNYSHSERLHVYIDEVLKKGNIGANQLDAIAISKGPGSYTGLRIGVSAAKGLCFALHQERECFEKIHEDFKIIVEGGQWRNFLLTFLESTKNLDIRIHRS